MNILFIIVAFYVFSTYANHIVLHVLHTNDVHSRFEMLSKSSLTCSLDKQKRDDIRTKCVGGVVRRSGFVRSYRQEHGNVVLLDAGDQYQGSLWFHVFRGNLTRHFLDHMQYDAMALGNHEFDNGLDGLNPLLKDPRIPIICANLVKNHNTPHLMNVSVQPSIVITRENRSIGIIGYLLPEVTTLSKAGSLQFEDEETAIRREVNRLKGTGVNILIAVGHSGLQRDKEIAAAIPDLDLVVGGHSHNLLYNGENPMGDKVAGPYPIVVNHTGSTTLVVTAGSLGAYMGVITMIFNAEGHVISHTGNPKLIDDTTPTDDNAQIYLNQVEGRVKSLYTLNVGMTSEEFDTSNNLCRVQECSLGNLFADAVVEILYSYSGWPNMSSAIVNGGGIRANFPKGNISYGDLLMVMPFGGALVAVSLLGSELRNAFEHSVANFSLVRRHGKFLQVSGFKVKYDFSKPNSKRVIELEIRKCFNCSEFEAVDKQKMYMVSMPSYLASGGDGYNITRDKLLSFDVIDADVMIKFFQKHSPVSPSLEGRITGMNTFSGSSRLSGDNVVVVVAVLVATVSGLVKIS